MCIHVTRISCRFNFFLYISATKGEDIGVAKVYKQLIRLTKSELPTVVAQGGYKKEIIVNKPVFGHVVIHRSYPIFSLGSC